MKFFLYLFYFVGNLFFLFGKDEHFGLIESFLEKNIQEPLDFLPLNLDKYEQNSAEIDLNQATIIKNLIQTTSLIVENHVFYILDKTSKTNYIQQMASTIEKVC